MVFVVYLLGASLLVVVCCLGLTFVSRCSLLVACCVLRVISLLVACCLLCVAW